MPASGHRHGPGGKSQGLDIVAAGEMGIGNTTPSSAIVAVLTGTPVETVTGRGSGVKGEVIRKKIELIEPESP